VNFLAAFVVIAMGFVVGALASAADIEGLRTWTIGLFTGVVVVLLCLYPWLLS